MDRLCTPWRYSYVTGMEKEEGCVFCNRLDCDENACFVLHRGSYWYIILNRFPYNSGHLLLVLNRHHPDLGGCSPQELEEMGRLLHLMERTLVKAYHPDGLNCGYNCGSSAGAGIPHHLHLHMLPRWSSDTNFMSVISETRIMPQTLEQSFEVLQPVFQQLLAEDR